VWRSCVRRVPKRGFHKKEMPAPWPGPAPVGIRAVR